MKFLNLFLIFVVCLGCASTKINNVSDRISPKRNLTNEPAIVDEEMLKDMSPLQMLQTLKANCCDGIMIEGAFPAHWINSDVSELEKLVNDTTPAAPVVSPISSIRCKGTKYVSTVGWEAKHLIQAIKKRRYPLSLCSTYDLDFGRE